MTETTSCVNGKAMGTNTSTSSHLLSSPEAVKLVSEFLERLEIAAAMDERVEGDPELAAALWPEEQAVLLLGRLRALEREASKEG